MIAALTKHLPNFQVLLFSIALENWLRYFLFAGLAWLLAYRLFKTRWQSRKIIQSFPADGEIRRELGWSLLTALIYGLVGTGTIWFAKHGWTQIYHQPSQHGMFWFWLSIPISILVHDAYFYWTHRLMHHRLLFRSFHRVHHQSINPSPWAAYSFGPLEAFVQAGIFPLLVFSLPIHPLAFMLFMIWQITFNVLGHTGYEFYPHWLIDSWLGKFLNTPTNHVQHHERFRGNYGLYFNFWDRWMKSNHHDYEARFRQVTRPS